MYKATVALSKAVNSLGPSLLVRVWKHKATNFASHVQLCLKGTYNVLSLEISN
jgi:hypothetical protein